MRRLKRRGSNLPYIISLFLIFFAGIFFFSTFVESQVNQEDSLAGACELSFKGEKENFEIVPEGSKDNYYVVDCKVTDEIEKEMECYQVRSLLAKGTDGVVDFPEKLIIPDGEQVCFQTKRVKISLKDTDIDLGRFQDQDKLFAFIGTGERWYEKGGRIFLNILKDTVNFIIREDLSGNVVLGCSQGRIQVLTHIPDEQLESEGANPKKDLENACRQREVIITERRNEDPRLPTYLTFMLKKGQDAFVKTLKSLNIYGLSCGNKDYPEFNACCNPETTYYPQIEEDLLDILNFIPFWDDIDDWLFSKLIGIESVLQEDYSFKKEYSLDQFCKSFAVPAYSFQENISPQPTLYPEMMGRKRYKIYEDLSKVNFANCTCVDPEVVFEKEVSLATFAPSCYNLPAGERGEGERERCIESFAKCGDDSFPTALGCVSLSFEGLINNFLFRVGLSLAGVFVFICLIYGGFLILISRGDTQRIQQAQKMMTNCVLGLLFIIFSVFILNLVSGFLFGVNIFAF